MAGVAKSAGAVCIWVSLGASVGIAVAPQDADGFELLRILQSHPELSALPVVVISSSLLEAAAQKAKSLGACEFLAKPTNINEYRDMVLGLHQRWLGGIIPGVPGA